MSRWNFARRCLRIHAFCEERWSLCERVPSCGQFTPHKAQRSLRPNLERKGRGTRNTVGQTLASRVMPQSPLWCPRPTKGQTASGGQVTKRPLAADTGLHPITFSADSCRLRVVQSSLLRLPSAYIFVTKYRQTLTFPRFYFRPQTKGVGDGFTTPQRSPLRRRHHHGISRAFLMPWRRAPGR